MQLPDQHQEMLDYLAATAGHNDLPDKFLATFGAVEQIKTFNWTFGRPPELGWVAITADKDIHRARVLLRDPRDPYHFVCDLVGEDAHRLEVQDESGLGLSGDHRPPRLIKTARAWKAFAYQLTHEGARSAAIRTGAVETLDELLLKLRSQPRADTEPRRPGARVRNRAARRELLEQLAAEYREFKTPREANRVLAERHSYSVAHIKRLLGEARALHLIPPHPIKDKP